MKQLILWCGLILLSLPASGQWCYNNFNLFPNPATSYSSLAYQTNSSSRTFSLGIFNSQGQIVQSMELTKSRDEIVIATDQLVPGLYLVQLRDENGQIIGNGKLVKK